VQAAVARCRPGPERAALALDQLELVIMRISPSIEAALRRAGVVPP
jgi:hypothetical protein